MALITCKECDKELSTTAEKCPHCGAKAPKPTSRLAIGIVGLLCIFILKAALESGDPPPQPRVKSAAELQRDQELKQAVGALIVLKRSMKNPASFELVDLQLMQGPAYCVVYRGTNSFNAIITSRHVFMDGLSSSTEPDWNKHCGGKTGTDYTHAKYALP